MDGSWRLREAKRCLEMLFPDCPIELRQSPMRNDYVLMVRVDSMYLIDPPPVGLIGRDRDRLIDEARD